MGGAGRPGKQENHMVTQVRIIDQNSFGAVIMMRVFSENIDARTWGQLQLAQIITDLKMQGEDLLDIDLEYTEYELDDWEVMSGKRWGRS